MPWSITLCCVSIVLVLCRLCDKLLCALRFPIWQATLFLLLIALSRILPTLQINDYVLVKPYAALMFILAASRLLARMKSFQAIRSIIGSVLCAIIYLVMLYLIPPESSPILVASFPVAAMSFALGYTADSTLTALLLGNTAAELAYSLMYLPFVEFGTSDFLDSAAISALIALTLSRILAHNKLAERRREVAERIAPLRTEANNNQ